MPLGLLRIEQLRCIERAELEFSPGLNLIWGSNGSGKTSILEGVFLLGRGRSFRTRNSERLIRIGQPSLLTFGRTTGGQPHSLGVGVSRASGTEAKLDGGFVASLTDLSAALPVQVINPEIHRLVEEGSNRRRRWLDWAVFHVEQGFMGHWLRYQRALKQRNAALRGGGSELGAWDRELATEGEPLTESRRRVVERLRPYWEALASELIGIPVRLGFQRGWPEDSSLADALQAATARDRERGNTSVGPHRADVTLRVEARAAREVLSRGQQKLTAIALTLAQLELLRAETDLSPTLLLDDPQAELDRVSLRGFLDRVVRLKCQLIVTALEPEFSWIGPVEARFHVEHGKVQQA